MGSFWVLGLSANFFTASDALPGAFRIFGFSFLILILILLLIRMQEGVKIKIASGLALSPSTAYFVVLTSGTSVSTGFYAWSVNNSPPVTSGGWGGDYALNSSDGSSWQATFSDPQLSLTATAVPEPDTLSLLALAGLLSYAWPRWREWRLHKA